MNDITREFCPLCAGKELLLFFEERDFPVNQNLLYNTQEMAKASTTGTLGLVLCKKCGFLFNRQFNESLVNYAENYDNNQMNSETFKKYIDNQIASEFETYKKGSTNFLEIGCGKGYYIKKLAEKLENPNNTYYGFDTSYLGQENVEELNLKYYKNYYNANYKHLEADFFISRHVIEHIENPLEFLCSFGSSAKDGSSLLIETPSLDFILNNNIIYDFTYEHCSYFTSSVLEYALSKAGFGVIKKYEDFGGQYMVFLAVKGAETHTKDTIKIDTNKYLNYINNKQNYIKFIKSQLISFRNNGLKVFVWGAGGKGTTFVNLLDKNLDLIDGLIDINPNKQNKFVGSTGHKVVSLTEALNMGADNIYVMNDIYLDEIGQMISNSTNKKIKLIYSSLNSDMI